MRCCCAGPHDVRQPVLFVGNDALLIAGPEFGDAPLEEKWLKEQLDRSVSKRELETLRDFTNPRNIAELHKIGSAAAATQIQMDHFPDEFKVETATS